MNRPAVTLLLCITMSCLAQDAPQQLMRQAVDAQQAGRLDEAIKDYRILLKQFPDIFEIRSNLGAALAGEGHYEEAIVEYNKALSLRSSTPVRLNLALAYYKGGELQKAADELKEVHAEDPANLQAVQLLADCYLQLAQNREVISLLTPVWNAHPEDDAVTYLLSTALVRDGQVSKGQRIMDRILKDGNTAESRFLMGTTKYMAADYPGAIADFQRAIELNPNLPGVHAYYGKVLLASGDKAGSQRAFEEELRLNPNDFLSNLELGVLLRDSQQYGEAAKYFRHALEIHPGDPGARFQIAMTEIAQGQLPEAVRDLESLTKDEPEFLEAVWQLATAYNRVGRKADAERERAIYVKLKAEHQSSTADHPSEGSDRR